MYVDHKKAYVVFGALLTAFKERAFPYNESKTPQDIVGVELGKYPPLVQARYWFYLCMYMRGPVDSNYAAKMLLVILQDQNGAGIFDPHDPRSHDEQVIDDVMSKHNFKRLLKDVKKFWTFASKKLSLEYDGDPRRIFEGVTSFDEIERICKYKAKNRSGFMGFQKKMASMLTYFLRDRKLIELKNFPPPVDFHLMRIMVLTGIIVLGNNESRKFRYETSSKLGYRAVEEFLNGSGVDPVELGDALWLLSGNLCSLSPKNREQLAFGTLEQERLDTAAASKKKRLKAHPGLFDSFGIELPIHISADSRAVRETCGRCPAKNWCAGGIPAGAYYNDGLLFLREEGSDIK